MPYLASMYPKKRCSALLRFATEEDQSAGKVLSLVSTQCWFERMKAAASCDA
ncbi:hypothetical protein [Phocaeicola vulgatus]|uniref:Uncharacterized protein n=1 Tax=Phocaeicola vulgatus TaxID=821 RepID=A0AAE4I9T3_PHOVU|nr:hypothetical protein [Phocaeicola vulgatus]MDU0242482.1 hypothetical protein [Phocaeicola vulgatus]